MSTPEEPENADNWKADLRDGIIAVVLFIGTMVVLTTLACLAEGSHR